MSNSVSNGSQDMTTPANDTDEARVYIGVRWEDEKPPQKLELALQKWFNKWRKDVSCTYLKVEEDGHIALGIKPAKVLEELLSLREIKLSFKDNTSASVTFYPEVGQIPWHPTSHSRSADVSSLVPSAREDMDIHEKKGGTGAAVGREEPGSCTLPFGHFLYVDQVYKEEMKRIERQNRVRIVAEVKLSVEVDPRAAGDPDKALSDVINLIQKCLGDASGFSFPLKHVDRRNLEDMFRVVVQENAKLLLMLSPDEITVRGPRKSLDDVRRCLKTPQHNLVNSDPSAGLYALGSRDTSPKIAMNIKDHLVSSGLTMDKNHWKAMNAAFGGKLADIRAKFGVEFVAAATSRGHVNVKPKSAHDKEAAALECHALRALIHLYQKVATSTMSHSSLVPDHARSAARASTEEGGTAGGATAEETCPICMDTFTNKKKLKCTHEFCAECLLRSEQSMGPICPMCKSVYGKVEGNQPEGHMSVSYDQYSLPGFPNCGKITITYKIPSGVQTKKHPKPGMPYSGISRAAYLPNNTEGKEVLELLRRAFTQKLIFTVGTSRTTGAENQVTWNDIHHKTSTTGGPQSFGYPDPGYLGRVRDELKAKGVE